ncbi:MAG: hypothetical protein ACK5LS_03980 [Propioniciclava sp.]
MQTLDLPAGSYTVTEELPQGWSRSGVEFTAEAPSRLLDAGESGGPVSLGLAAGTESHLRMSTAARGAELAVSVAATPAEITVGERFTWTVVVADAGPSPAPDVLVTLTLPEAAIEVALPAAPTCTQSDRRVVGSVGVARARRGGSAGPGRLGAGCR